MAARNFDRLVETLGVVPVVVPGESIHDAFGRRQETEGADSGSQLGELADDGIPDLDGTGWELDPEGGIRVGPVAPLTTEPEFGHHPVDLPGHALPDEVEIEGLIRVGRVDRDDSSAGQNDGDPGAIERLPYQGGDLLANVFARDRSHFGLPDRRGLRRSLK